MRPPPPILWCQGVERSVLFFCFGDQHLIIGDFFVSHGRQNATKKKIELGALQSGFPIKKKSIKIENNAADRS